ncbi:hypothetical protein [Streptomyces sp. NPDC000994]
MLARPGPARSAWRRQATNLARNRRRYGLTGVRRRRFPQGVREPACSTSGRTPDRASGVK